MSQDLAVPPVLTEAIIETNTISYEFLDLPLVIMNKSGKSITVFTERGSTNSAKADKLMQIYS